MPATQPLPQDVKPDFSDVYKEARALEQEVQQTEQARKDVAAEKAEWKKGVSTLSRDEIIAILQRPATQISADDYTKMMNKRNELMKLDEDSKKQAIAQMSTEDKFLMRKAFRWHELMRHLDKEAKLELSRLEILENKLFGDLEQSSEEGAMPLEVIDVSQYTENQALEALKRPEMRVTNEDMIRAEELFRSQTPGKQMSERDKDLITKVQEFSRLVAMLSTENRQKLAKEDMDREMRLQKAEKEGWWKVAEGGGSAEETKTA